MLIFCKTVVHQRIICKSFTPTGCRFRSETADPFSQPRTVTDSICNLRKRSYEHGQTLENATSELTLERFNLSNLSFVSKPP